MTHKRKVPIARTIALITVLLTMFVLLDSEAFAQTTTTQHLVAPVDFGCIVEAVALTESHSSSLTPNRTRLSLTKTDIGGRTAWRREFQNLGHARFVHIAVAPDGRIAAVGTFKGRLSIDDVSLTAHHEQVFLLVLSPEGRSLWIRRLASLSRITAFGASFDSSGRLALHGWQENTAVLAGAAMLHPQGRGRFLAYLDGDGYLEEIAWLIPRNKEAQEASDAKRALPADIWLKDLVDPLIEEPFERNLYITQSLGDNVPPDHVPPPDESGGN